MDVMSLIAKTATSGLLVCALAFGNAGVASAEPMQNMYASTSVSSLTVQQGGYLSGSKDSYTEYGSVPFHTAIQVIMRAKAVTGELTYKINSEGKNVYMTEVAYGDGEVAQFYYEVDPKSAEVADLSNAVYSPYAERSGGNEWFPKIWSGTDSEGIWVRFNRAAQGLMVSAGGTALKVAICAIPGVNTVGCAVVWGATVIAKQVMKRVGRCPEERPWLYAYPTNLGASNCRVS